MKREVQIIREQFSRASSGYASLASVQAEVAQHLCQQLKVSAGSVVLDVGSGPGTLLAALVQEKADIQAVGLDSSSGMVDVARKAFPSMAWVRGDARELPFASEVFDLVCSSSSYQWVPDLEGAFCEVRRVLKKGGVFSAALFGRQTLQELREALTEVSPERAGRMPRLPSDVDVRLALARAGLEDIRVSVETRVHVFCDVRALLRWVRDIGAGGAHRKTWMSRQTFHDLERAYQVRYGVPGGISAGFEIIRADARK